MHQAVIMKEYYGFENPRSVALNKLALCCQCRPMGEILEVQIKLPFGYVWDFVRVRAKINATKKLVRFVSIIKNTKKVWHQV